MLHTENTVFYLNTETRRRPTDQREVMHETHGRAHITKAFVSPPSPGGGPGKGSVLSA